MSDLYQNILTTMYQQIVKKKWKLLRNFQTDEEFVLFTENKIVQY